MRFKVVAEMDWRPLSYATKETEKIKERVARILETLEDVFSVGGAVESGLEVRPSDIPGVLATINSPVGSGRIRLVWRVIGGSLTGVMQVEREVVVDTGAPYWQAVWGINVPEYDDIHVGAGKERLVIQTRVQYGVSKVRDTMYSIGMSMLYAIVNGPQVDQPHA